MLRMTPEQRQRYKLTKTESLLLETLEKKGRAVVTMANGRGPEGGKVRAGHRGYNAANGLVERGLARVISRDRDTDTRHGYSVFYSTIVIGRVEV